MKLFINFTIIASMMLGLSCSAGDDLPGYQKELQMERDIYKNAKVAKEIRYLSESDIFDESSVIIRVRYYDEQGRLTLDSNLAEAGEFGYKYEKYTYDTSGYLVKLDFFGYDSLPMSQTYKYDNSGKLIESKFNANDAKKFEYFYNDDGYMIEQIGYSYPMSGHTRQTIAQKSERKTFEYDDNNQRIKVLNWRFSPDSEGEWAMDFEENYTYKNGRIVESSAYHHVYEQRNAAVFYYNDKGLMTKTTPKSNTGKLVEPYSQYFIYEYR